jgi:TIGR00268 family protein
MSSFEDRTKKLLEIINEYAKEDIIVAFSGGVDSSLILKLAVDAAKKTGSKVYAVTVHTRLHPMNDIEVSKAVAAEVSARHEIIYVDELQIEGMSTNPVNRCYLCKSRIFSDLKAFGKERGIKLILEGTNSDDLLQYRPGIQALKELGIISPFVKAGFSKDDVRKLAEKLGISVKKRPSAPCMATRFPYGDDINYEDMAKLDEAEEFIRSLGYYNVRIRKHKNIARIEIDSEDLAKFTKDADVITNKLKSAGFDYVCLDLEGFRSGSMDIHIDKSSVFRKENPE